MIGFPDAVTVGKECMVTVFDSLAVQEPICSVTAMFAAETDGQLATTGVPVVGDSEPPAIVHENVPPLPVAEYVSTAPSHTLNEPLILGSGTAG